MCVSNVTYCYRTPYALDAPEYFNLYFISVRTSTYHVSMAMSNASKIIKEKQLSAHSVSIEI